MAALTDRDWAFASRLILTSCAPSVPASDPYGPDLEAGAYTGDGVAVDSANARSTSTALAERGQGHDRLAHREAHRHRHATGSSAASAAGNPSRSSGTSWRRTRRCSASTAARVSDPAHTPFGRTTPTPRPGSAGPRQRSWVNVTSTQATIPKRYHHETNTMPQ